MPAASEAIEPIGQPQPCWLARTPARRLGDPADIAAAAVWLASEDARFVHGTTLDVDGGALHTYAA
ncbi:SDR family oxidoreductase [Baekduia alba]|uniref:SDR family oxidoreductase n=1 Tax=Baekduia alba TaxID=2997333 RepID=UPI00233F8D61|nr:SDR family oxidoreductase [Baekduia alba]